jgi:cell division transport system permease protein
MNGLAQHLQVILATFRRLGTTPLASLLNIMVIGTALSLPAGMYLILQNLQLLADQVIGTPQISLFLKMDAGKNDIARIGNLLKQHKLIDHYEFVSREQAFEQLKHSSEMPDLIAGLAQNPLPDAYIVYPKKTDSMALDSLRDELQKWPRLEKVQLDSAWAHKLEALLKFGRQAVLVLTALLSFALVAITFNTIRLQILTQRDEIEVSNLIGATHSFIRLPFLYYGLMQGLLGGVAAWLIILASLTLLNNSLAGLSILYASNFSLHALSTGDSLTLLLFSAFLGWIGAWLSVAQHLWQIELN